MQVILRAANPEEASQVAEVLLASRKAHLPFAPWAHSDLEIHGWVRAKLIPESAVTVAVVASHVVGVLSVSRADRVTWVDQLYVHPDHIGLGIGSKLLAFALARNPAPVRLYTFQQNKLAREFYSLHGFIELELTDGSANEEHCPDVLYEWAVAQNAV